MSDFRAEGTKILEFGKDRQGQANQDHQLVGGACLDRFAWSWRVIYIVKN